MRLVFTKLTTPLKDIEVDFGNGEGFKSVTLDQLETSGEDVYLYIPDESVPNSIRVRVSSEEVGNFDMIQKYQLKDDDGNILGGNVGEGPIPDELEEIFCYISEVSKRYRLELSDITGAGPGTFFENFDDNLCYFATDDYVDVSSLLDLHTIEAANDKKLSLRVWSNEYERYFYTPVQYKIRLVEKPEYPEPPTETPTEQN